MLQATRSFSDAADPLSHGDVEGVAPVRLPLTADESATADATESPRAADVPEARPTARQAARRIVRTFWADRYTWLYRRRSAIAEAHAEGRLQPMLSGILRVAGASGVAYVACQNLLHAARPVTGALTALLVVQATLTATLAVGARRVAAVVTGVLIAVGFSIVVGFSAWSLAAVVASSLLVGKVLSLQEGELEVAVSAMLILAVSGSEQVAESRILETLVGAAVGVLVNVVMPPRPRGREAVAAVRRVGSQLADVLDSAAEQLAGPVPPADIRRWSEQVRAVTVAAVEADDAIDDLVRSRRLNPWAISRADTSVPLRHGLTTLEHVAVATRGLFAAMADDLPELSRLGSARRAHPSARDPQTAEAQQLRSAFAMVLIDAADGVRAYRDLVVAEANLEAAGVSASTARSLVSLDQSRQRLSTLLLADVNKAIWLARTPVVAGVERLLRELDPSDWDARHERWRSEQEAKATPLADAMTRLRESPLPAWMFRD